MKPAHEWAEEDIDGLDELEPADITLLVRDLHGLLTALERYDDATERIRSSVDDAFADPGPVSERCGIARGEFDALIDYLLDPEEHGGREPPEMSSAGESANGDEQSTDVEIDDNDTSASPNQEADTTEPEEAGSAADQIIRTLLERPATAIDVLNLDNGLQPPAGEIGQLYRTELEVSDPDAAEAIYDDVIIMSGAVTIALDSLESFAEYHPGTRW